MQFVECPIVRAFDGGYISQQTIYFFRFFDEQFSERLIRIFGVANQLRQDCGFVAAGSRGDSGGAAPDPVVSSVMAQCARLQKDVAQRREKK